MWARRSGCMKQRRIRVSLCRLRRVEAVRRPDAALDGGGTSCLSGGKGGTESRGRETRR